MSKNGVIIISLDEETCGISALLYGGLFMSATNVEYGESKPLSGRVEQIYNLVLALVNPGRENERERNERK